MRIQLFGLTVKTMTATENLGCPAFVVRWGCVGRFYADLYGGTGVFVSIGWARAWFNYKTGYLKIETPRKLLKWRPGRRRRAV